MSALRLVCAGGVANACEATILSSRKSSYDGKPSEEATGPSNNLALKRLIWIGVRKNQPFSSKRPMLRRACPRPVSNVASRPRPALRLTAPARRNATTPPPFHGIGRLNHVAIAVPDLKQAMETYKNTMVARVSDPVPQPEHGVTTVFIDLGNTKIELLHPLGDKSPIANFLAKNKAGGVHHICLEVDDINAAVQQMLTKGVKVLDPKPKIGAHGKPVVFLHPKDLNGVLVELEQK